MSHFMIVGWRVGCVLKDAPPDDASGFGTVWAYVFPLTQVSPFPGSVETLPREAVHFSEKKKREKKKPKPEFSCKQEGFGLPLARLLVSGSHLFSASLTRATPRKALRRGRESLPSLENARPDPGPPCPKGNVFVFFFSGSAQVTSELSSGCGCQKTVKQRFWDRIFWGVFGEFTIHLSLFV